MATEHRKTVSLLWDHRPSDEERLLIIFGGQIIADLEDTLLDATDNEAGEDAHIDAYAHIIIKLNKHFLPKKNKDFARFQFGNLKKNDGESLVRYYTRIREIAKKCSFSNDSGAIRDHLIKTMMNNVVCIKAIRKNWTSTKFQKKLSWTRKPKHKLKRWRRK
ncbi:Hypothetical predicted protein [Paramuricea clavata]|uniref:Uncharacterized protein n=1 Tax=Paramuricea clavata TaxID=317549 RepID=A0A6S7KU44_PARCT|nr:Hypothetical predicted protein [Paramuricea clavata]